MLFDLLYSVLRLGYGVFMELSDLLLQYLKVLIWPVAVITLALVYRRPIVSVLHRLRKASGWGVEVETEARDLALDTTLSAAQSDALEHAPTSPPPAANTPQPENPASTTTPSNNSPEADIAELHRRIERLEEERSSLADAATHISRGTLSFLRSGAPNGTSRDRSRMSRVDSAWFTLNGLASIVGLDLGLPIERRTPVIVFRNLAKRGYLPVGPWRQATRLTDLYDVIQEDALPPSEETTTDFVTAAQNLMAVLRDVQAKVITSRRSNRADVVIATPESEDKEP